MNFRDKPIFEEDKLEEYLVDGKPQNRMFLQAKREINRMHKAESKMKELEKQCYKELLSSYLT